MEAMTFTHAYACPACIRPSMPFSMPLVAAASSSYTKDTHNSTPYISVACWWWVVHNNKNEYYVILEAANRRTNGNGMLCVRVYVRVRHRNDCHFACIILINFISTAFHKWNCDKNTMSSWKCCWTGFFCMCRIEQPASSMPMSDGQMSFTGWWQW